MKRYYSKRHKGIFKYFQHKNTYYGYRFLYYDHNHKRHEKSKRGFTSSKDALKAQNEIKQLKGNNKGDITVKAWCLHYINMIKPPIRKITTYNSYKILLTHDVIPFIGDYKLKDISLDKYQDKCLNHLSKKKLSRTTIKEVNARVQTVMNYAVKDRQLNINPLRLASIPRSIVYPKREIMSKDQLRKFNKNLRHHSLFLQVIFFTLELTGMRDGEMLGLRFKSVNLKDRVININRTRDSYGVRKPKTPSSIRKIKITTGLTKLLRKYAIYCKKHFKVTNDTLFILGKHGKPLMPRILSTKLKQLLIESGLHKLVRHFVVHCFRHQFASHLINQGVSVIDVSRILGHKNGNITLKYYANAVPNSVPDINKLLKK